MVSLQLGLLQTGVHLIRKHLFGFQVTPIGEQRERSDETADRGGVGGGRQRALNVGTDLLKEDSGKANT